MGAHAIVGAGGQGRVVLEAWRAQHPNDEFVFVDDNAALHGTEILGAKVIGPLSALSGWKGDVILAIGHNPNRLQMAERFSKSVTWGKVIYPTAWVAPSATIGEGSVVFAKVVINTGAVVGNHSIVNTGVIVEHDCILGVCSSVSPGACMGGRVEIGEGAFISTGVTLAPRTKVGAHAVVGAGAVVVNELPPRTLSLGVPAKVVRTLDASFDWKRLL